MRSVAFRGKSQTYTSLETFPPSNADFGNGSFDSQFESRMRSVTFGRKSRTSTYVTNRVTVTVTHTTATTTLATALLDTHSGEYPNPNGRARLDGIMFFGDAG